MSSTRAERRRLQKSILSFYQSVLMAGEEHLRVNARHRSLLARLPRHYRIQRGIGLKRLAALRLAWRFSAL